MTNRAYLSIVFPFILTSLTVPLLGIVDTAIMGHLPDAAYMGGVAIGTVIFNSIYWLFGFLRVSTTSFTAQAKGQQNKQAESYALFRPIIIALFLGVIFILFQSFIFDGFLYFLRPESQVALYTRQYYYVLIWGAPFVLSNYVLMGWLMGMSRLQATVFLQIGINVLNIVLAFVLVMYFDFRVYGLACATLLSQFIFTVIAAIVVCYYGKFNLKQLQKSKLFALDELKTMMSVNRDLMLRTVFFLIATNLFMSTSASFGKDVLAVNTILFQLQYLIAYLYDGFGNASSIIVGEAVSQKNFKKLNEGIRLSFRWSLIMAVLITIIYCSFDTYLIGLFTHMTHIKQTTLQYSIWLAVFPVTACFGLVFYGVFSGAAYSAPIRDSAFFALLAFVLSLYFLKSSYGNNGLWIAFLIFSSVRSVLLVKDVVKLKNNYKNIFIT